MFRSLLAAAVLITACDPAFSAVTTPLAAKGQALQPVVVAEGASPRVQAAARNLAGYLAKITGATFEVKTGDGTSGLAVGVPADFRKIDAGTAFDPKDPTRREEYLLRSHPNGLYLLGATDLAVEDAVWDLLRRAGYRQYFPGETWEFIPSTPELGLSLDESVKPDFWYRRIWYGFGIWPENGPSELAWRARNRVETAFPLSHGHSYDGIYSQKKAVFAEHPEYLAEIKGKREPRGGIKFCLSNADCRKLIVDWAVGVIAAKPATESISLDPSDGNGWCECAACKAMGSVSDRVVTVCNEVARAINDRFGKEYGPKYVGINIYNMHSEPPTIPVDPHVIGLSTTAFIRSLLTHDQIMDGWTKKGARVGVYDYFSVMQWDWDAPGAPGAAQPEGIARHLAHYYDRGARLLSAESSDNWGPAGLGYYVAARVLWDVREAKNVAAIRDEFLTNCFGAAREPMARFYKTIDGKHRPMLSEHLIGTMYRCLSEARAAAPDPRVHARLRDLVLYTRYQEMYMRYLRVKAKDATTGDERNRMLAFCYRIRTTRMGHTLAMCRTLSDGIKDPTMRFTAREKDCPWKDKTPFTEEEIAAFVADGVRNNPVAAFDPVQFSDDLVPAAPLKLPHVPMGNFAGNVAFEHLYLYTWVDKAPATIPFKLLGGYFYDWKNNVRVRVTASQDPTGQPFIDDATTVSDKQIHDWTLQTPYTGLHKIWVVKGHGGAQIQWTDGTPMTGINTTARFLPFYGTGTAYFYVPKGTTVLGGFIHRAEGDICDSSGRAVASLKSLAPSGTGYFSIPIAPGQDGRLWKLEKSAFFVALMTVPSCVARSAEELLLPREVVEADAPR